MASIIVVLILDKYNVQVDCTNLRKDPVGFTKFSVSQQFYIFPLQGYKALFSVQTSEGEN